MSEEKMIAGSFFIDDKGNKVEVVDAKAREELKSQKGAKADKLIGIEHAGKLLYVGSDGIAKPLMLGNGLEIVNGVLCITGSITPETEIIFESDGGGTVTMSGAEFLQQVDGAVLISSGTFTDQGSGVVLVN